MKTNSYARLAAAGLGVGLIVLVVAVLSRDADRRTPASTAAQAPAAGVLGVDEEAASAGRRVGGMDAASAGRRVGGMDAASARRASESGEASELGGLERGAPGGPGEREEPVAGDLPEQAGSVTVAVQDATGRPFAGVLVSLYPLSSGGTAQEAVTGDDGEALFEDLAAGHYSYLLEAPDRPDLASGAPFELAEGERKYLSLRLGRDLSILGRVLKQDGEPVPGMEVTALRRTFASSMVREVTSGEQGRQTSLTNQDGSYAIQGLEEGEYVVHTTATDLYPSVRKTVRAGSDSVNLLLVENLRVHGTVTDLRGEPLARVHVVPLEHQGRSTRSDSQGRYLLHLGLGDGQGEGHTLGFHLAGYEQESLVLVAPPPGATQDVRLDLELRALREAARVSGVVQGRRGEPVPDVRVYLNLPGLGTHYRALTDADGEFSIEDVELDSNYRLVARPRRDYRDLLLAPIAVTGGELWLDVVLEPLASGRLSGRMVDLEGSPIPNFRLWLVNTEALHGSLPVSSDASGYFRVEEAPEGRLAFDTRAFPKLYVSGIDLPVGGDIEVTLPLDWGDHVLRGSVLDDRGIPVAGADVALYWSHRDGTIESRSTRKTVTDPAGFFQFSQLGPGVHQLDVRASEYDALQKQLDVGSDPRDVEVRLGLGLAPPALAR